MRLFSISQNEVVFWLEKDDYVNIFEHKLGLSSAKLRLSWARLLALVTLSSAPLGHQWKCFGLLIWKGGSKIMLIPYLIFLWVKTPCNISETYKNPFWEKSKCSGTTKGRDKLGQSQFDMGHIWLEVKLKLSQLVCLTGSITLLLNNLMEEIIYFVLFRL